MNRLRRAWLSRTTSRLLTASILLFAVVNVGFGLQSDNLTASLGWLTVFVLGLRLALIDFAKDPS